MLQDTSLFRRRASDSAASLLTVVATMQVRTGVGKYLPAAVPGAAPAAAAAPGSSGTAGSRPAATPAAAAAAAQPPGRAAAKPKLAQQPTMNFDAW